MMLNLLRKYTIVKTGHRKKLANVKNYASFAKIINNKFTGDVPCKYTAKKNVKYNSRFKGGRVIGM
ncbi:hypothetical protein [Olivibacter domesticus]|uniref:Uncharacterized protein n=1 Tax=Olivibacter domesticus TaxID=407022 RepID=A0A1H7KGY6_OLID1|nr:hypothetical protein [Olivibacter domesticus]SEK85217.1 hypothetical protein SAMN05661044_01324 [Olivibacter domesticus]